jgi:hypothetical protein
MQDAAIQESMGPIQDRSKENLVSTDNGVIMARIRLRKAALAAHQGQQPDGTIRQPTLCARPRSCCPTMSASTRPRPTRSWRRRAWRTRRCEPLREKFNDNETAA